MITLIGLPINLRPSAVTINLLSSAYSSAFICGCSVHLRLQRSSAVAAIPVHLRLHRQKFFAGVELLRKAKAHDMTDKIKEPAGDPSFEFKGITPDGILVGIHIREEIEGSDKKLYLISTF